MRILLFILSLCFTTASIACYAPHSGAEFDALINVKKLKSKNKYYLSFPRSVNGSKNDPEYYLTYVSHAIEEGCNEEEQPDNLQYTCPPRYLYSQDLNLKKPFFGKNKELVRGKFKLEPKIGYSIHLEVIWPSSFCRTYGTVVLSNLKSPNKQLNNDATAVAPIS